tara:strand:+ start:177 stop:485 length:309 start_codon:yes stop_codon:yes gene_type:complete
LDFSDLFSVESLIKGGEMKTGMIENWAGNPVEIGPIYPFVGYEVHLFLICFALWVVYTIWQMKFEAAKYSEEVEALSAGDQLEKTIENNRENRRSIVKETNL